MAQERGQMSAAFHEFVAGLRNGDLAAAERLVREYEADLLAVARARLRDPRIRRVVEATDLCQSVFANFFVRMSAGQFEVETPEDLAKLLAQMVRNEATDQIRRQFAAKRGFGRILQEPVDDHPLAGNDPTASQVVGLRELLTKFDERLPPEMQQISRLRREGYSWEEIADQLGEPVSGMRKRFFREINRAATEMKIQQ